MEMFQIVLPAPGPECKNATQKRSGGNLGLRIIKIKKYAKNLDNRKFMPNKYTAMWLINQPGCLAIT